MHSVLLIDAEDEFASHVATTLRDRGADVTTISDGKAWLEATRTQVPDAIVLCVELPRMSGYAICTRIKKDKTLRDVPLVITSAEATEETFEHHKKLKTRAEEYLRKPFEPEVLVEVLSRYMSLNGGASMDDALDDIAVDESPLDEVDAELLRLADQPNGSADLDLGASAGLSGDLDVASDELLTTVGISPDQMAELDGKLRAAQNELETIRRERDEAVANERATQAQLQSLSASQVPQTAPAGREMLALKKEISAKDHEILELRDRLQQKDKELLGQKDQAMELESQVVQAQEEREAAERQRVEQESQAAADRARSDEERKQLEARQAETEEALTGANGKVAELEEQLNAQRQKLQDNATSMAELSSEVDSLKGQNRALGSEVTRLGNEVDANTAEAEGLREQLAQGQEQVNELRDSIQTLEQQRSELESSLAQSKAQGEELEANLSQARASLEAEIEREKQAAAAIATAAELLAAAGATDAS